MEQYEVRLCWFALGMLAAAGAFTQTLMFFPAHVCLWLLGHLALGIPTPCFEGIAWPVLGAFCAKGAECDQY